MSLGAWTYKQRCRKFHEHLGECTDEFFGSHISSDSARVEDNPRGIRNIPLRLNFNRYLARAKNVLSYSAGAG